MNKKILLVDDESNILSSLSRQLKPAYEISTAESGQEGLEKIKQEGEFALVISDYKMPEMNGLEFLTKVKDVFPDTVRVMLTGQADFEAVINVINEGNIFRFLTKPCPPELLKKNVVDALNQFQLIKSEKELLSKTLSGSIQVMTDILVLAKPQAFNRGLRVRDIVKKILNVLNLENAWQIEIAAMLSQIGCVTIPDEILYKIYRNLPVSPEDKLIYQLHTKTSSEIIGKIPRFEEVAKIILNQEKYYNGSGFPNDGKKGDKIPLGARILRLAIDYDSSFQIDNSSTNALEKIKSRTGWYDDKLVSLLEQVISGARPSKRKYVMREVKIIDLDENMYMAEETVSAAGVVLNGARQRVTHALKVTLKNYLENQQVKETVKVLCYVD